LPDPLSHRRGRRRVALLYFALGVAVAGCGRSGCTGAGPEHDGGAADGGRDGGTAVKGRWHSLPGVDAGALRSVDLAMGPAGVFLGTVGAGGPGIHHGRWTASGDLDWSPRWEVPPPPSREWPGIGDDLAGLRIAIDGADPMRIAVTRLEYQGGSFGAVAGRWGGPFVEIPYPDRDVDIRFGVPLVLQGTEAVTVDPTHLFRFRLGTTSVVEQRLDMHDVIDELGWHAALDAKGRTLVLSVFREVFVFGRTANGDFALGRRWKMPASIAALGMTPDAHTTVVVDAPGAFEVTTYDDQWRERRRSTITVRELDGDAPSRGIRCSRGEDCAKHATIEGARVVLETARTHSVVDLPTGRVVRLEIPPSPWDELRAEIHGDVVLVTSLSQIGVYSLSGAFGGEAGGQGGQRR